MGGGVEKNEERMIKSDINYQDEMEITCTFSKENWEIVLLEAACKSLK